MSATTSFRNLNEAALKSGKAPKIVVDYRKRRIPVFISIPTMLLLFFHLYVSTILPCQALSYSRASISRETTLSSFLPRHSFQHGSSTQLKVVTVPGDYSSRPIPSNPNAKNDPEWQFFDTARIHVSGGSGGDGCVAFRREKNEAMGGPNGGRGGGGGSVIFVADQSLNTLANLRRSHSVHVRAPDGKNGKGKNQDGSRGGDVEVRVPPGTLVRELQTGLVAGEVRTDGQTLTVARGGRGGRGNAAFATSRRTAPRLAERGEPGAARWLAVELRLVADVGFVGKPNAGKSTLLAASSAAKPKIANYPFTTLVPNLGVCDLVEDLFNNNNNNNSRNSNNQGGKGLVLCDIPGLIEGAAAGAGLGQAFLRHVQRCRVLLHLLDGTSPDPLQDFQTIQEELKKYDTFLASKPQVIVINKVDVPEVREKVPQWTKELTKLAGHSRVMAISAATTEGVKELMVRIGKFVDAQPEVELPPAPPEVNFALDDLATDSDDFEIITDPAYPNQFRIRGTYIERVAQMTHWEYPEAVERFGRQLEATGMAQALLAHGAQEGDLVMVDEFDFEFSPQQSKNPYVPQELWQKDVEFLKGLEGGAELLKKEDAAGGQEKLQVEEEWQSGGGGRGGYVYDYMEDDIGAEELVGFNELGDWELLDNEDDNNGKGWVGGEMSSQSWASEDGDISFDDFFDDEEGGEVWTS